MKLEDFVKVTYISYKSLVTASKFLYKDDERVIEIFYNKEEKSIVIESQMVIIKYTINVGLEFLNHWIGEKPIAIVDKKIILYPYEGGWCVVSNFGTRIENYHSNIQSAIKQIQDLALRKKLTNLTKLKEIERYLLLSVSEYRKLKSYEILEG